ncbi:hypothetical protein NPIL_390141 [Nephila pilipes]|uniref:Uncharacterized protein n=1 Tax=Nephila pilipes TaxID=299642 RepID=A0A8X6QTY1_NEPPI|nr:hypothetical protein NPIL_390141 [Nephila pilipes]
MNDSEAENKIAKLETEYHSDTEESIIVVFSIESEPIACAGSVIVSVTMVFAKALLKVIATEPNLARSCYLPVSSPDKEGEVERRQFRTSGLHGPNTEEGTRLQALEAVTRKAAKMPRRVDGPASASDPSGTR